MSYDTLKRCTQQDNNLDYFMKKIETLHDLLIGHILIFGDDAGFAEAEMDKNDDAYYRRGFIRALFAMIEGSIFVIKQTTLVAGFSESKLSFAEVALLKEETFELDNKGDIRSQAKFLRIADNLRFTAKSASKVFNCELNLGIGTRDWDDFLELIKIRNRITHPKSSDDFEVSKDEAELARKVFYWFNDFIVASVENIAKKVETLKKQEREHHSFRSKKSG